MLEMKRNTHGIVIPRLTCAWCELACVSPQGWVALYDGDGDEPVVCCGPRCEADVRADEPARRWQAMPLSDLVADLAARYGHPITPDTLQRVLYVLQRHSGRWLTR